MLIFIKLGQSLFVFRQLYQDLLDYPKIKILKNIKGQSNITYIILITS